MITFNKSTNNFNIPFAVIAPKKKNKKDSKEKNVRFNNDDPYSNVIGVQQALINQDNILEMALARPHFKKDYASAKDEFADFAYEKLKRERQEKQKYYEAEALEPEAGPSSMIKRKAGDEDDKSSSKAQREKDKKNY